VLQKAQNDGVEQNLLFRLFQAFEFIEQFDFAHCKQSGFTQCKQFGFAHCPEFARVFIRQQNDGSGEARQQLGREQNVLLARRTVQDGDVAVLFRMPQSRIISTMSTTPA